MTDEPDTDDVDSPHVRPPRQKRSRETLERIVEAARSLLDEEGLEALTVSRIVERAGSSVGSFYARFDGKADLLRYLEERTREEVRGWWDDALASRSWEDLSLEGVVRSVVELLGRLEVGPGRTRGALAARSDARAGETAPGDGLHGQLERDVRDLLLRRRSEIDHPNPLRAAQVAYWWALGGIRELSSGDADEPEGGRWSREEIVEEVTRGVVAYLGAARRPDSESSVEFFDVWQ